jgi:hypothetical protein
MLVPLAGAEFVDYEPPAGLFRTFADLDGSPEAVLRFANRFGRLGGPLHMLHFADIWRLHINALRERVRLAAALESGDLRRVEDALGPLTQQDLEAINERRQDLEAINESRPKRPPAAVNLRQQDLEAINERRRKRPSAAVNLRSITDGEFAHAAVVRLGRDLLVGGQRLVANLSLAGDYDPTTRQIRARFRHDHLLGFMQYEVVLSLFQNRRFRQCAACGIWFQLERTVNRADRATCSNSCRGHAYRQRMRQTIELHQAGKTPKVIAAAVGSDVSQVREWISKHGNTQLRRRK